MRTTAAREASSSPSPMQFPAILTTITTMLLFSAIIGLANGDEPTPKPWPEQFHSIVMMNISGQLELADLWYDWTNGRNLYIIQYQLGNILYDLEWNNGTSFYYTLDSDRQCSSNQLGVGILRPNWLDGATYLGQRRVDKFLCNVWDKTGFLTYYEDVESKRPVLWVFFTGNEAHVMTFEVGAALEDEKWQVPWYCFEQAASSASMEDVNGTITHRGLLDFVNHRVADM